MEKYNLSYDNCRLCGRLCGVNRNAEELGYCAHTSEIRVSRASLHKWEEPIICGAQGSGTIFFSGCSLKCVFCQNKDISRSMAGKVVDDTTLADMMMQLQADGACNINFVTPTHYAPSVIESVSIARARGLTVPIVYNTSSYDTVSTICSLRDTVDIFLPDFKYYRKDTARAFSSAEDYPSVALLSIREMVSLRPKPVIEDGIMKRGVIIRILLLPGHLAEAKLSLGMLYREFGESVYFSLMSQYTPMQGLSAPLDRRVTRREYEELLEYASKLGITNAFIQDYSSASTEYIPEFDYTGVE